MTGDQWVRMAFLMHPQPCAKFGRALKLSAYRGRLEAEAALPNRLAAGIIALQRGRRKRRVERIRGPSCLLVRLLVDQSNGKLAPTGGS